MSDNIDLSKNVQPPLPTEQAQLRQYTLIVYVLYVVSIFVGLTSIVAIIMNYIKRDEVSGTWMESHFNWQIRTFWITLIGAIIGAALSFILIGIPILFAISIWFIYRVIKGLVVFVDNKPIGDGWF